MPHATGTRTNSQTDLTFALHALRAAADAQGSRGRTFPMTIGAPKALGQGHTMGESRLRAAAEGVHYVLGETVSGVASHTAADPTLKECLEHFRFSCTAVSGNPDGGALMFAQGFGGYVGALALRAAHDDALTRYRFEYPQQLREYLMRRAEIRANRKYNERQMRRGQRSILTMIDRHRWSV